MKKSAFAVLIALIVLLAAACGGGKTVAPLLELSLDEVNFSAEDLEYAVKLGSAPFFVYAKTNQDGKEVAWATSDNTVITLGEKTENGIYLTALKTGNATVTASVKGLLRKITVTVAPAEGTRLTLNPSAIKDVYAGYERILTCSLDNISISNSLIEFSSNAPDFVSVDSAGKIKVLKTGTAAVTAKYAGLTAICTVTTNQNSPRFWLSSDHIYMSEEQTYDITSGISADPDYVSVMPSFYFRCTDVSIADISIHGIATAKKKGTVTVYITNSLNNEELYLAITVY